MAGKSGKWQFCRQPTCHTGGRNKKQKGRLAGGKEVTRKPFVNGLQRHLAVKYFTQEVLAKKRFGRLKMAENELSLADRMVLLQMGFNKRFSKELAEILQR